MTTKNKSTFAIFKTREGVDEAVSALKLGGFSNTDISVLMPDRQSTKDFAHEKATKAPEGTATGATAGAAVGGALGWLVGIGSLAIPGVGPFIAAGPIMAALAGAGVGGAVGGLTGALIGMGIPEYEAKRYEGLVKDGGILISVHSDTDKQVELAEIILKDNGGEGISTTSEASSDKNKRVPVGDVAKEYADRPRTTPPHEALGRPPENR